MAVLALIRAICPPIPSRSLPLLHPLDQTLGWRDCSGGPYDWTCTVQIWHDVANCRHINKTKVMSFYRRVHHKDHCKRLQHMDNSKLSSGGVVLLSCCDRSRVNYHRNASESDPQTRFPRGRDWRDYCGRTRRRAERVVASQDDAQG